VLFIGPLSSSCTCTCIYKKPNTFHMILTPQKTITSDSHVIFCHKTRLTNAEDVTIIKSVHFRLSLLVLRRKSRPNFIAEDFVPVNFGASNRQLASKGFECSVPHCCVILCDCRLKMQKLIFNYFHNKDVRVTTTSFK